MKICIPIPDKKQGGMYTFLANFRKWLNENQISITKNIHDEYDVLFLNSWVTPLKVISEIKYSKPNTKIVHRVDGSHEDYGGLRRKDHIQSRVNFYSDLTIFQSIYSRFSTQKKYKIIYHDGPIIYNPVDIETFKPSQNKLDVLKPIKVCCVSFSTNPLKGTGEVINLASKNPNIDFILCGNFPELPPLTNIKHLGHLTKETLALEMRKCDILINLSQNDPCPNVVLEGMSSGLPIMYRDSGGTPELVGDAGIPTTPETFLKDIEIVASQYSKLSSLARNRVLEQFTPNIIFEKYIKAIELAFHRTHPSKFNMLLYQLKGYPIINPSYSTFGKIKILFKNIIRLYSNAY